MSEQKTIKEWYKELPLEYRKRAMKNAKEWGKDKLNETVSSFSAAIDDGFVWSGTPEGAVFWEKIYSGAKPEGKIPEEVKAKFALGAFYASGYAIVFEEKTFNVGCQTFSYKDLKEVIEHGSSKGASGRTIGTTDEMVFCDAGNISSETFERIVEKAKKLKKI